MDRRPGDGRPSARRRPRRDEGERLGRGRSRIDALETTMRGHLGAAADGASSPRRREQPARPVPGSRDRRRDAGDPRRRPRSRASSWRCTLPRVVVFGDLLSADECDELIALRAPRLARSETVADRRPARARSTRRAPATACSSSRGEFPVCARIEAAHRGAARLAARERRGPADPALPAGRRIQAALRLLRPGRARHAGDPQARRPARRLARLLPQHARGGRRDRLPRRRPRGRAGARATPSSSATTGRIPSTRTLHGGAPVIAGEKWVATKWLREGRFE